MATRTKIICTIGPAVASVEKMVELIEVGMDVARINFSHGTDEEHITTINNLKEARHITKRPLAIMLDTKGPEIRLGKLKEHEILLIKGQKWLLVKELVEGDISKVSILPGYVLETLSPGMRVLFSDGYISSQVIEVSPEGVLVEIDNSGVIKSGKGVNIPNAILKLPAVTEKDISDIRLGCKHDIDIIAASFVRSADHVLSIKKLLAEEKKLDIMVVAKIENNEGVQNFDSIVQVADGIMIARGDLGVEVPLSQVPKLQKMMIRKSCLAGKPTVTATQMLESMITNPRPTRAEASDVANAIYDSTSSVMLSGETAVGAYPLETVRVMKSIIEVAEEDFPYRAFFNQYSGVVYHDVPTAVTLATVKTSYASKAQAIFAFTTTGSTARLLSRFRPQMPIIAMASSEKSYHQMAFFWGVIPFLSPQCETFEEAFVKLSAFALEQGLVAYGDLVIVTSGSPFGVAGTTNMMVVENIGDVLVRAHKGYGSRVHGKVVMVTAPEDTKEYVVQRQLLVLAECDESYLPLIRESAGIILQNHVDDVESEKYAMEVATKLNIPVLVRADSAFRILKEGQMVTLDPEKGLVYKGVK